jgi:hypothetical protein
LILAKVGTTGGTGDVALECTLFAKPSGGGPSVQLDHAKATTTTTNSSVVAVPLQALATFSVAQDLVLTCGATGGGTVADPQLSAISIGTIH